MPDVFESDARQSNDTTMRVSRFSPMYRALTSDEKRLHDDLKSKAEELAQLYDRVKSGRHRSLAFTSLEQSVMWVIKELTS